MMNGVEFLPAEYGYVVIVVVFYCILNLWMSFQVGGARKKYNVPYPAMYAVESDNKDAKIFNCIQRGHQNSLENMPVFFALMILGGIKHPLISASFGVVYIVGRFFYFKGYSTGDPKDRFTIGKYAFMALFVLMLTTISCGVRMLIV